MPTPKGCCFFLINLLRGTYGRLHVGDIYRCRSDIEVDNAVVKEGARLAEIGASIRILLLGSMIRATLSRTIVQSEKLAIRKVKSRESLPIDLRFMPSS